MTMFRKLRPTIHIPSRDKVAARHVLQMWALTGVIPVAHIVAEPETEDGEPMEEPIAA